MRMSNFAVRPRLLALFFPLWLLSALAGAQAAAQVAPSLAAQVEPDHGSFSLRSADGAASLRGAAIAARVDNRWLRAADYGKPAIARANNRGELGAAQVWTVTYSGVAGRPDLIYRLRVYDSAPFADLQVTVKNSTAQEIAVQDIRPLELTAAHGIDLGGPEADDRVLSDSFSEGRPSMKIHDLSDAPNRLHRGVDVQLIYNRRSGASWFAGALTTYKFLTILRLHLADNSAAPAITSYEIDSTGTTELTQDYSLRDATPQNRIELAVTLKPGAELASERLLLSLSSGYHRQLETYASTVASLHHARVTAPEPMGWWSWTSYYSAIDQKAALTNAEWLSANLKSLGYNFFLIDEGYSIARGDYLTPNPDHFPGGMEKMEQKVAALGLVPGVWTAPFEVSDQSWVFRHHPEWLVHNRAGEPILLGKPLVDHIYVLDTTHPGAQEYLRKTYSTMVNDWGLRYVKLDFMEDSCIEGEHYVPNTSALEAQRIGLKIIRSAVGEKTLIDKDQSVMLNPVGIVDIGRISHDTSHKFETIKGAAFGIAARYYMNRNFFVADPDAFMVTASTSKGRLSLDEAKVSIAVAAVSGGMMEIGDDLPSLGSQPERLALVENRDLIGISHLGKASIPVDLMSYPPEDLQPSIFLLQENPRQSILTLFNWTDAQRTRGISLDTLGFKRDATYRVVDIWSGKEVETCHGCVLSLPQPPHSVQMLKIVGPAAPPITHLQP